jgi:hypothetical protein
VTLDTLPARLRIAAARLGDGPVKLSELAEAYGTAVHGTLLVLLATPCVLPLPGIGNVMGAALIALALAMWRGEDTGVLPGRVASVVLPGRWASRVLRAIARFYELAGRWSCRRLERFAVTPRGSWMGPKIALMGGLIFLPIPQGNVLPALAVVLLGLGLALRDGVAILLGAAVGVAAVGYTVALAFGAWAWIARPLIDAIGG